MHCICIYIDVNSAPHAYAYNNWLVKSGGFCKPSRAARVIVTTIDSNHHRFGVTNMKTLSRLVAVSLTAIAVSGAGHAHDALPRTSDAKTIYEGVDSQGQIVRVTVSSNAGAKSVAVSSRAPQYPELHWTAHIASGTAATIAH